MDKTIHTLIKSAIVHYEGAKSKTGLPHGFGVAIFVNHCHYDGAWKNGSMHGQGTLTFLDGITYFGQMHNNSITGKGIYTWPNGVYEGEVEDGVPHGVGRMFSKLNGVEYKGEWLHGKRHGIGRLIIESSKHQIIYNGQWYNDYQQGKGTINYPSGNRYEGQWVQGEKNGFGKMQWLDRNEEYEGEWRGNTMHGRGEYTWFIQGLDTNTSSNDPFLKRHNKYIGEFVEGKKEGFGRLFYGDGAIYEGEFFQDEKHGLGLYLTVSGEIYKGEFINDRMTKSSILKTIPMESQSINSLLDHLDHSKEQDEMITKLLDLANHNKATK
eukprot:g366.t1